MEMGYVAHGSIFFSCTSPNLLLRNFGFVVVAFLSPLVRLYMGSPAMDGELGPFDWGFLVLVFFLSSSLSVSVVLVPQLVCSFMETLKMSETLISRD